MAFPVGLILEFNSHITEWPRDWLLAIYVATVGPVSLGIALSCAWMLFLGGKGVWACGASLYSRLGDRLYAFVAGSLSLTSIHLALFALPLLGFAAVIYIVTPRAMAAIASTRTPGGLFKLFALAYLPGLMFLAGLLFSSMLLAHTRLVFAKLSARFVKSSLRSWTGATTNFQIARILTLAHITDLHLTANSGDKPYSTSPWSTSWPNVNDSFQRLLDNGRDQLGRAECILFTGDVVDTGRSEEWQRFFDMLPTQLRAKIVLVPGNHDINIHPGTLFDDDTKTYRKLKLIRWLIAADWLHGERTQIISADNSLTPLRGYLYSVAPRLEEFIAQPPRHSYLRAKARTSAGVEYGYWDLNTSREDLALIEIPEVVWNNVFPMLVSLPNGSGSVIVADSNRPSSSIPSNAFGSISPDQIRKIAHLRKIAEHPCVIGMHHHLGMPSEAKQLFEHPFNRALAVTNVEELCGALTSGRGSVIFTGHRHCHYVARLSKNAEELIAISGGSATLYDDTLKQPPSSHVYDLHYDAALVLRGFEKQLITSSANGENH